MSTLTFGIIKPDAVRAGNAGKIIDRILQGGFNIRGMKLVHQTKKQAEGFYEVECAGGTTTVRECVLSSSKINAS